MLISVFLITSLAVTSSATPVGAPAVAILTSRQTPSTASCSGTDLLCNGPSLFGLCSNGQVIWQPVAPGTQCLNGVVASSNLSIASIASQETSSPTAPSLSASNVASPTSSVVSAPAASASANSNYQKFSGDGSTSAGWPAMSEWVKDFDSMWQNNMQRIISSGPEWSVANNSAQEISDLGDAIQSAAHSSGVDARFIVAIGLQESGLSVRVITTKYSVSNPGLFQSHEGAGTCNDNGQVQNPCPASMIQQMVSDGVFGTSTSAGMYDLKDALAQANGSEPAQKYYQAARIYNSGSIPADGNLSGAGSTDAYCSDIANRLVGWNGGPSKFATS